MFSFADQLTYRRFYHDYVMSMTFSYIDMQLLISSYNIALMFRVLIPNSVCV